MAFQMGREAAGTERSHAETHLNYLNKLSVQHKGTRGIAGRTPEYKSHMLRNPRTETTRIEQPYSPLTTLPKARPRTQGIPRES
jgi:hypothetical protein